MPEHKATFNIRRIVGLKRNKDGKLVPSYQRGKAVPELFEYSDVISNLHNYDGYHLILTTEAKPFTALNAFVSGMGLAYVDDDLRFIEPFGFNRMPDKAFAGICIEDWDEFIEDINSHSSRYYRFLELL